MSVRRWCHPPLAVAILGACSSNIPVSSSVPDYGYDKDAGSRRGGTVLADAGVADAGVPGDSGSPPIEGVLDCTPAVQGARCERGDGLGLCCGSSCLDATSDPDNCGGCGVVCSCGSCSGGVCAAFGPAVCGDGGEACPCPAGELPLLNPANGPEWPPMSGPQGCVPTACPANQNGGSCAFGVASQEQAGSVGRTVESLSVGVCCGGVCVDPAHDPENCGGCGLSCGAGVCLRLPPVVADPACTLVLEPGCSGGTTLPDGGAGCPASPCAPGLVCSFGICLHPPSSCAQKDCPLGTFCNEGECDLASNDPFACLTAQGNPGVYCGNSLPPPGALFPTCNDLTSDPLNCGGCCQPCAAGETCVAGACQGPAPACGPGRNGAFCDLDGGSLAICCFGACTDPLSDTANCGGCGVSCLEGETCCEGVCTSLRSDTSNCGACGVVCNGGTCGQQGCEP